MPEAVEVYPSALSVAFEVNHRDLLSPKQAKAVASEIKHPDDIPSKDRIVPGSSNIPLGVFPPSSHSFPDADEVASKLVESLNKALKERDAQAIANLFHENSYWRDHLCLTWDLRTLKGREKLSHFVNNSARLVSIEIDTSTQFRGPKRGPIDGLYGPDSDVSGIEFFVKVTTKVGTGRGVAKLAEVEGQWRFFTLFTTLQELRGYEEQLYDRRPNGAQHGEHVGRQNWQDRRNAEVEFREREPAVLIVGKLWTSILGEIEKTRKGHIYETNFSTQALAKAALAPPRD